MSQLQAMCSLAFYVFLCMEEMTTKFNSKAHKIDFTVQGIDGF